MVDVALPAACVAAGSADNLAGFLGMGPAVGAIPGPADCAVPAACCCCGLRSCSGTGGRSQHVMCTGS